MICIDLGNATTKIAICRPGYPEQYSPMKIIKIGSSVLFDSDGNFYYGQEADESLTLAKIRMYNRGFKNKLGRKSPIIIANQEDNLSEYSALDITCKFLSSIKGEFEKNGFPLKDLNTAMITVPANFSPAQISEFKKAAELAGFDVPDTNIIPDAVAIGYCVTAKIPLETKEKNILVADWGESALKLSLITKNSCGKYTLSPYHKTMNYCGGNSLSDALSAIFMNDVKINEAVLCKAPELCIQLNQQMRMALKSLSTLQSADIQIKTYSANISRSVVEKIILDKSITIKRDIADFVERIPDELKPKKVFMSGEFMHYVAAQGCIMSALPPGMEIQTRGGDFSNDAVIGLVRYAHDYKERNILKNEINESEDESEKNSFRLNEIVKTEVKHNVAPSVLLGIPDDMSLDKKRKELDALHEKWRKLRNHNDSAMKEQAEKMLDCISKCNKEWLQCLASTHLEKVVKPDEKKVVKPDKIVCICPDCNTPKEVDYCFLDINTKCRGCGKIYLVKNHIKFAM